MLARLSHADRADDARRLLAQAGGLDTADADALVRDLAGPGRAACPSGADADALTLLARSGLVAYSVAAAGGAVSLVPCRWDFAHPDAPPVASGRYKLARLAYTHAEHDLLYARHPAADCFATIADADAAALLARFHRPIDVAALAAARPGEPVGEWCALFARAGVLQACNADGKGLDDLQPERRHWELHDAIFHARSRLGRTDGQIGGVWPFKGELPQPPAVKPHPWTATVIPLPGADIARLLDADVPFTRVVETRRSVRHNGVVPLTAAELGAFLFRTVRQRALTRTADGDYVSRPHPGGGAIYENEIYVTIDRCVDLPRGFYYYDPARHALCLISAPNWNSEGLLEEARLATAGICRPQILFTIASRHTRFTWKYRGMAYAAQLKNVGVIYQTMYLVATAMGLGGCALGLGNTDRFLAMTGLDWFQEGSVGEFLLGRPL